MTFISWLVNGILGVFGKPGDKTVSPTPAPTFSRITMPSAPSSVTPPPPTSGTLSSAPTPKPTEATLIESPSPSPMPISAPPAISSPSAEISSAPSLALSAQPSTEHSSKPTATPSLTPSTIHSNRPAITPPLIIQSLTPTALPLAAVSSTSAPVSLKPALQVVNVPRIVVDFYLVPGTPLEEQSFLEVVTEQVEEWLLPSSTTTAKSVTSEQPPKRLLADNSTNATIGLLLDSELYYLQKLGEGQVVYTGNWTGSSNLPSDSELRQTLGFWGIADLDEALQEAGYPLLSSAKLKVKVNSVWVEPAMSTGQDHGQEEESQILMIAVIMILAVVALFLCVVWWVVVAVRRRGALRKKLEQQKQQLQASKQSQISKPHSSWDFSLPAVMLLETAVPPVTASAPTSAISATSTQPIRNTGKTQLFDNSISTNQNSKVQTLTAVPSVKPAFFPDNLLGKDGDNNEDELDSFDDESHEMESSMEGMSVIGSVYSIGSEQSRKSQLHNTTMRDPNDWTVLSKERPMLPIELDPYGKRKDDDDDDGFEDNLTNKEILIRTMLHDDNVSHV